MGMQRAPERRFGDGCRTDYNNRDARLYGSELVSRLREMIMCPRQVECTGKVHFSEQMFLAGYESPEITSQGFKLGTHPFFFYFHHLRRVFYRC